MTTLSVITTARPTLFVAFAVASGIALAPFTTRSAAPVANRN